MLNKVLIITHGLFGIELKKSAEMIMGEQENVEALGLIPGQSVDELHAQALEIVKKNEVKKEELKSERRRRRVSD